MKIKFCGAAKAVTGSCYYVQACGRNFLIDCGMFQGNQQELNKNEFPFNPADIDFMILTHAHIDHSGKIPLLVKKGFSGTIYCTSATCELAKIMLRDSAHIQEKEAEWENKKRMRKGLAKIDPLYTVDDAEKSLPLFYPAAYGTTVVIDDNIKFTFKDAGHLLGSAITTIEIDEEGTKKTITFTGDLGNVNIPVIRDYEYIEGTNYLITESTYGNRLHEEVSETENLGDIIIRTVERGGNVIIPTFAVGRVQEILYILNYYIDIEKRKKLKNIEIYLDSPLAIQATEIFEKHKECYDDEALKILREDIAPLYFNNLRIVQDGESSKALNGKNGVVIMSSSGMCEAGRIKHHLKHNIWRKDSAIVFVGYQAEGTLGRKILDGEKWVSIMGEKILVQAEIYNLPGLSGHADQKGILKWVKNIKQGVRDTIFITHGDPDAQQALEEKLHEISDAKIIIPGLYEEYKI